MTNRKKYFLDQDEDCHWYIIPNENRAEWDIWTNLDPHKKEAWIVPIFAEAIDGFPSSIAFFKE